MNTPEIAPQEISRQELVASSLSLIALNQHVQTESDLAEYGSSSIQRKWAKTRVRDLDRHATVALERVFMDEYEPVHPIEIGATQPHDKALVQRGAALLLDGTVELDDLLDSRTMRSMPQAIRIAESEDFNSSLQAIADIEKSTSII